MIDGLIAGRLFGEPEERVDRAGKSFSVVKVRAATGDGEMLFVNVIAFEDGVCSALSKLRNGDSIALTGSLTPRVWTDKQGNPRPALDMVAYRMLALHSSDALQVEQ